MKKVVCAKMNMANGHYKPIARMRGIREAIAYMKEIDADTAITYGFIRKLCDTRQIKSVVAGRKILINLDELMAYFNVGVKEYGDNS